MIKECLTSALNSCIKTNTIREGINGISYWNGSEALAAFVVLIIYVLFILIVGKFLWNEVLCKLISIAKPANTIWQILGVAILLNLLYA